MSYVWVVFICAAHACVQHVHMNTHVCGMCVLVHVCAHSFLPMKSLDLDPGLTWAPRLHFKPLPGSFLMCDLVFYSGYMGTTAWVSTGQSFLL